jgi:predicted nucleic acid-binding protein
MKVFVDTNILIYTSVEKSDFHVIAKQRLSKLIADGDDLFVNFQVLKEYVSVLTRRYNVSLKTAVKNAQKITENMTILFVNDNVMNVWETLINSGKIMGKTVFDCSLAATMMVNGISNILTLNVKEFNSFAGINVISL